MMIRIRFKYITRSCLYILIGLLMLTVFSCSSEQSGKPGGDEMEVTFILNTPKAATRVAEAESEIKTVEVLVFEADGKYLYTAYGTESGNNGNTFNVSLRTGNFDLLVLANSRRHIQESFNSAIPAGTSREKVFEEITAVRTARWETDPGKTDYENIPMWGDLGNKTISENMSPQTFVVSLVRMLARVDIKVKETVDNFTVKSAYIYNYHTAGRIIPDQAKLSGEKVTDATVPSGASLVRGPLDVTPSYMSVGPGDSLQKKIYIFEAEAGTDNLLSNTCLVIGAEFEGVMSYYRIDFQQTSSGIVSYLPIKRNFIYEIEIKSITSPGFPDPDKAFRSQRYGLGYEVRIWEDGAETQYGHGEQYRLDITKTMFEFSPNPVQNPGEVTITTTHPDGWYYELSTSSSMVTGNVDWITVTGLRDPPEQYVPVMLTFEVDPNLPSTDRAAYIHIISGNLTNVITVRQF